MAALFRKKIIRQRKTIGQILKKSRLQKGITLDKAEEETQIRKKHLEALEADKYDDFSAEVYKVGFLKKYAAYLGLDNQTILDYYKKEHEIIASIRTNDFFNKRNKQSPFAAKDAKNYENKFLLNLNPQIMIGAIVGFFVVCLFTYIGFQVKSFAAAPELDINNPANEIVVSLDHIIVEGKTDTDASLYINNQPVPIDISGSFKQEIKLSSGLNVIEITAKNKVDKETKKSIQVLAKY